MVEILICSAIQQGNKHAHGAWCIDKPTGTNSWWFPCFVTTLLLNYVHSTDNDVTCGTQEKNVYLNF